MFRGPVCPRPASWGALLILWLVGAASSPLGAQCEPTTDCNANGILDLCDIDAGTSADCNLDGVPDECEIALDPALDCNLNGTLDTCELALGTETDCNANGVLDSCDFAAGAPDCNSNGIPDECETDCDGNGVPDSCDLAAGAPDCNGNGLPDLCDLSFGFEQDCDGNAIPDVCEIESGASPDCDGNGIPDTCDLALGGAADCDADGVPDSCQLAAGAPDCDGNGQLDSCDLVQGLDDDCDGNGVPDLCDLAAGALDCNANGVLDLCDVALGVTVDTELPQIGGLPTLVTQVNDLGACGAVVSWADPVITDNCAIETITMTASSGDFFPVGSSTVTVTVIDLYGNMTTDSFSVEVTDQEAPTLATPLLDRQQTADPGVCGAIVNFDPPVATDNCGIATVTSSHSPGDFFPVGTTVVTYQFTDLFGHVASVFFPVTVVDLESPQITSLPAPISQSSDLGDCGAVIQFDEPLADDACGVFEVTSEPVSGSFFPIGVTEVVVRATDLSGNEIIETFTVEVLDLEPPEIQLGPFFAAPFDPGLCFAVVSVTPPVTSDACGIAEITNSQTGLPNASGLYPAGDTVVTWTVTDTSGNVTTANQTVSIPADPSDCNGNGIADVCDIASGISVDCNGNGVPDDCDLLSGTSDDFDGNAIPDECQVQFRRGDPNGNFTIDLTDAVFILDYLFVDPTGVECFDALDANDNGEVQIPDAVLVLYHIFAGGIPPRPPFLACGVDPTADGLDCAAESCP